MFQMRMMMMFLFLFLFLLGVTCDSQKFRCDEQDQSSLLRLKHHFVFHSSKSYMLNTWNSSSDCCDWGGVTCCADDLDWDGITCRADEDGHVVALELGGQYISVRNDHSNSPLFELRHLQFLDLSVNNLSSEIPDFLTKLSNLTYLFLSQCGLHGKLPPSIFTLANLQVLFLDRNDMLYGELPESIGNTTSLTDLVLDGCGFSGSISNIRWENLENLVQLELSGNAFSGTIPTSIFNLHKLKVMDLSNNNFSGTFDLSNLFQNLANLSEIDLSFNKLSIIESVDSAVNSSLPHQLWRISLVSCNLKAFPSVLINCSISNSLDLSDNKIVGEIPSWIWKRSIYYLNLSHNSLTGFERPSPNHTFLSFLRYLDLSSNLLQGEVPLAPLGVVYAPYLMFLSLSNNSFHGRIPPALCNLSRNSQPTIDLSDNLFSGTIPSCLTAMSFGVLNLKRNNLGGNIPDTFHGSCSLHTLDLSNNHLEGAVPKSMMKCKALEVVNLGNNGLKDEFPVSLMNLSNLCVLVLRSNQFYGTVRYETRKQASGWSKLQIVDIAANNFSGKLPVEIFRYWTGMMGRIGNVRSNSHALGFDLNYQDTVVVNNKGSFVELVKILTIFTTIDFSCNHFEGSIPPSIGNFTSLYALNLSHNRFTGQIPSSFGNLKGIESLDLANNRISGVIPGQLASLTFISCLNLSYNQLVGKIPTSTQLQSFPKWSYIGNKGLYGPPLDEVSWGSGGYGVLPLDPTSTHVGKEINWKLICVEIGYVIGLGAVIGSLVFWRRWRFWFHDRVDRILFKVFPLLDPKKRKHGKRA